MKKLITFLMVTALVLSMSMMSVFAETEELPIDGDTLREVNDAQDAPEDAEGASGPSYSQVGHWRDGTGQNGDCLVPFSTDDWTAGGVTGDTHLVFMNYNNYIRVSKSIDLSKYSKIYVTYSAGGSIEGNELGFFSKATAYGQAETKNEDGLLFSVPLEDYDSIGWTSPNTVEVDISNINYSGELYASYYMATTNGACITAIEFEVAEGGQQGGQQGGEQSGQQGGEQSGQQGGESQNPPSGDTTSVLFILAAAAMMATVIMKKKAY